MGVLDLAREGRTEKERHVDNRCTIKKKILFFDNKGWSDIGSHEDVQIARQISELFRRWVALKTERGRFIEELKTVDNFYAKKMVEHLTAVQEKYDVKLMHVFTLVDELDLSARSKDVFYS
ncbi:hypothetical protein CTI12_AA464330 [Artemisia annua]|uniref:Uncharacterized protein n=1 Tax=Artemisia annua TaxID=35608 RepID=A0A2U1LQS9_ARTAN|nr:hypothetical protein CTI12_AA464330 [Artemisia annua]